MDRRQHRGSPKPAPRQYLGHRSIACERRRSLRGRGIPTTRRLRAVHLPYTRLWEELDEDHRRAPSSGTRWQRDARCARRPQEGRTAVRRHRDRGARLVRRRRSLAVAHPQLAEHVVPRPHHQGERLDRGNLRARHLGARRHLPAASVEPRGLERTGAPLCTRRCHSHTAQRERRHAATTRDSPRQESAERRDHLLRTREQAVHRDHPRRERLRGQAGAPPVEHCTGTGRRSRAPTAPELVAGRTRGASHKRRPQPHHVGFPPRPPGGEQPQL